MRYSQVGSLAFTLAGVVAGCLVGASATLPSSRAVAQELDFDSGEAAAAAPAAKAAPAAAAPAEGPPSEALANGLRLYKEERYPEAIAAVKKRPPRRLIASRRMTKRKAASIWPRSP